MARFLDSKTSQNASYANSIAVPITAINTPELIAQQTLNLSGGTANLTVVSFTGIVATQLPLVPLVTNILITVVRGTTPSGLIVFSASQNLDLSIVGPQLINFAGSDFNAPNTANVVYSVYIQSSALGTVRVGPESCNLIGVSD
ncbi:hypothetical protein JCM10914A_47090 [Paenibacillus sp. JCM 10914]|uniref:hypothetical protein n=1 Tax=Paenibacillus sp. JCM 10914 TaxID=1236974 RepID=UPI00056AA8E3|nr:hypothetical protein [Paenibacillus sp. JCM 10914]